MPHPPYETAQANRPLCQTPTGARVRWLDTNSESRVVCTEVYGIARVEALAGRLFINNTSRNLEMSLPKARTLHLLSKFQETAYPDQEELSGYDLDFHALVLSSRATHLFAPNHFGLIRAFPTARLGFADSAAQQEMMPEFHLRLPGDIERYAVVDDCFVCTSPSGYHVDDAAQPGLLISSPWPQVAGAPRAADPHCAATLPYEISLEDWGVTTALAVVRDGSGLVVAAGQRLGLFALRRRTDGSVALGPKIWECLSPVTGKYLAELPSAAELLVAGYAPVGSATGPQDWEDLGGGGFLRLALASGTIVGAYPFGIDLAWGNGGEPLALVAGQLIGADRRGGLHAFALSGQAYEPLAAPVAPKGTSLGLAHLTVWESLVVVGFNRGGHRLLIYDGLAPAF